MEISKHYVISKGNAGVKVESIFLQVTKYKGKDERKRKDKMTCKFEGSERLAKKVYKRTRLINGIVSASGKEKGQRKVSETGKYTRNGEDKKDESQSGWSR